MATRSSQSLLLALCAFTLSVYLNSGCRKSAGEIPTNLTETFENQARTFTTAAALPLDLRAVSLGPTVTTDSLNAKAQQVIEEMVFLKTQPDGTLLLSKVRDGGFSKSQIADYTMGLVKAGLITTRDWLVRFEWTTTDGQVFKTLGTVSADGKPRFEPILHFNGISTLSSPGVKDRGGWTWAWKRTVQNGFDMNCVEVEWTVKIITSPDGCNIVDPAPHIEITKQLANCWGWEQKTTKGEIGWCNPEQECICTMQQGAFGEDCIKWAVVTYVATGASNIEVKAGAKGEVKGIELDAEVSFDVSRFGAEATYETINSLCAKSGGK